MAHSQVARRELTVELENGLHMLPCSKIAKAARDFGGPVRVFHGKNSADATSVLDLLGLGVGPGAVLVLEADGEGASGLLEELAAMFQKDFDLRR